MNNKPDVFKKPVIVLPVDIEEDAVSIRKVGHDRYVVSRLKLKGSKVVKRTESVTAEPLRYSADEARRLFSSLLATIE